MLNPKRPPFVTNSLPERILANWNSFWFAEAPGHSLAAFRILFGIYLLGYFLSFAPNVNLIFSNQGIYIPYLIPVRALAPVAASALYIFTLLVIGAFILGYRTLLVTPLVLVMYLYFYFLNLAVKNTAYDRLNLIFLFILCFANLDGVWSIRDTSGKGAARTYMAPFWGVRMIRIQVCLLYFGAGLWKLLSPHWHTGQMMRWTLIGPWGTPLGFWLVNLDPPMWFFTTLTWSVILFEFTMPVALNVRKLQPYAFAAGVGFHLSVALFLSIPEFLDCVAAYILFVPPERTREIGSALFQKLSRMFGALSRQ